MCQIHKTKSICTHTRAYIRTSSCELYTWVYKHASLWVETCTVEDKIQNKR